MSTPEPRNNIDPDRRRERRNVSLRGYIVRDGGISQQIELIDLNYGGCGIRVGTELKPGESVQLAVLGRGSIPAEVRWFSDGRAGLDFTPSIKAGRKQVPRRTSRSEVAADANLRIRGRNSFRVRVFDLSSDGCRVELVELPKVKDSVSIKFDGLDVLDADVCWVERHQAGLMFENRIHPAVLDLLLARLGTAN
ncbi:MAG: PilZ domain-containing protein [Sphingomicrobium sp.]